MPDVEGIEHAISSNEVFHLEKLPKRIVIAGGGYIANEFAGIFHQFGSHVTLVNRSDVILRGYDEQMRDRLLQISMTKGIEFRFNSMFDRIEKRDGNLHVAMTGCDDIEADAVLFATGRVPNVEGLGLAEAGVELGEKGQVKVDENSRTSVPSIFAVGDVTDRIQLTPVAIREGHAFADTQFGNEPWTVNYDCVPARGLLASADCRCRDDRGAGAQPAGPGQDLYQRLPADEECAGRAQRAVALQAGGRRCDGEGRRHSHDRARCAGNPPGGGNRGEGRAQEVRFRPDRRSPPDHGRRIGIDALMHDILIIGAGHNGLTCAHYLAKKGLKVAILEAADKVGGAAVTDEFHKGFRNSAASYTVSLLQPKVIRDMELERHGLKVVLRKIDNFLPGPKRQLSAVGAGRADEIGDRPARPGRWRGLRSLP